MRTFKQPIALKTTLALTIVATTTVTLAGSKGIEHHGVRRTTAKTSSPMMVPLVPSPHSPDSHAATRMTPEARAEEDAAYAPTNALYLQAKASSEAGDLAGAEKACLDALDSPPVLHGHELPVPFVPHLLGQIYLKDGQYEKAIYWLQGARLHTIGGSLNLDLALAYLRLGDYDHARQCYSDKATLQCSEEWTSKDLPGTNTPQSLEASILLARGLDVYMEHWHDEALLNLHRAHQLAPANGIIAYFCADILNEKRQYATATRLYSRAISNTHGIIHDDAVRHYAGGDKAVLAEPARPSDQPLF